MYSFGYQIFEKQFQTFPLKGLYHHIMLSVKLSLPLYQVFL